MPTRECSLGAGETGAMADKDSTRGAADAGTDGGDEATRIVPSSGFSSAPPIPAPTDGGSRQSTIPPGQLLHHTYRVEALLARGGMGGAYRATHTDPDTEIEGAQRRESGCEYV